MVHPADALEYRHRLIARFATLLAAILLLLMLLFWVIARSTIPPPDEETYEVAGAIDFGNRVQGSKSVNNFQAPSETPAEAQTAPTKPTETKAAPTRESIITKTAPSEVKAVKVEPTTNPVKESVSTQPSEQPATTPTQQPAAKPQPKVNDNALFKPGGSNDGNSDGVGNSGSPKSQSLGSGLSWGEGGAGDDGGLGNRQLLRHILPRYNAQEEGRFVIEVSIRPDGTVSGMRIVKGYAGQINIKQAVEKAVYQWKFSPVGGGSTQKVKVTYTFKLR